jgi:carbon monoxide dehydrogenase subunit G
MEAVMNTNAGVDVRDEFDNSFDVSLPPAEAWPVLSDIRRIVPSIPGVELTDVVDERTYRGTISVPLGPLALTFASVVKLEVTDPINHTARFQAQGADTKGRGEAHGTVSFRLEAANGGSRVLVHTDLVLSGAAAQYGSGREMIQATAAQIMTQFAANLRAQVMGRAGS